MQHRKEELPLTGNSCHADDMKNWIVRFATLLVFNVAVLLLIVLLVPSVKGAWGVLWGGVILTFATMWLKPALNKWFAARAAKKTGELSKAGLKVVTFLSVFVVALIVWVLTVLLSQLHVDGWFWGYVIPPIALLLAWVIYDAVDDKLEAQTSRLYDSATGKKSAVDASAPAVPLAPAAPTGDPAAAQAAPPVPTKVTDDDGLTPEQRKMFDELG